MAPPFYVMNPITAIILRSILPPVWIFPAETARRLNESL